MPSLCQLFLAFGVPSGADMFIILVLLLVLFGSKHLPTFARGLGRSMNEFGKAKEEFEQELREASKFKQRDPEDGPDSLADTVLLWLFGISVLLFILSFIMPSMR